MGFNFPAAPIQGEVFQPAGGPAWMWDGEKWRGGGIAGPQKEQLFDISGLTQKDITVPTWAKSMQFTMYAYIPAPTTTIGMRVSSDGTTFFAGASDYSSYSAPVHNTGTLAYATSASTIGSSILLTASGDNLAAVPATISGDMQLVRLGAASTIMIFKAWAKWADSAAGTLHRNWQTWGWPSSSLSLAQIKALRFFSTNGAAFAAGSSLHIRWIGDDAQMPVSNAIPEAPNDGKAYVRRNGVWQPVVNILNKEYQASAVSYPRTTTTEGPLTDSFAYVPKSPTSIVYVQAHCEPSLTSVSAAHDDYRGRLVLKYYDTASTQVVMNTILVGASNQVTVQANRAEYFNIVTPWAFASRRTDLPTQIYVRLYGNPDYANLTLDCSGWSCAFEEIEP
jgi:hypothetical protein